MKSTPLFLPVFNISGVVFYDFASQHVTVDVSVYFCSTYRLMTEHTLDGSQVGSSFQQMGGK